MKRETIIPLSVGAIVVALLFIGASITGWTVLKVDYNDLCKENADCLGKECCRIYDDKDVGVCMEHCSSFEFLCKADGECEAGTVCCVPDGKEYGICNRQEACLDVDVFAEYVGKVSFMKPGALPETQSPAVPSSARAGISPDTIILVQALFIAALIGCILWLLLRKETKGKKR